MKLKIISLIALTSTLGCLTHLKLANLSEKPSPKKAILIKGKLQTVPLLVKVKPIFQKNKWKEITRSGIEQFEKYIPNTYICPGGVPTIGYGFTDKKLVNANFVSLPDARRILDTKLDAHCDIVRKHVKVKLTEPQMYALASFTYNCGEGSLLQLISGKGRLNSGNYSSVSLLMPKYCTAKGKVLKGLERRRAWEVNLWKQI